MGLIDDIPSVDELVTRIVRDAEELITGEAGGRDRTGGVARRNPCHRRR